MCAFFIHLFIKENKILSFHRITASIYTLFSFHLWRHSLFFHAELEVQRNGSFGLLI